MSCSRRCRCPRDAQRAVAFISKVDLYNPEELERREEFASEVAKRLCDCVNRVVPVSAGLRRALDVLPDAGLVKLIQSLSKLRNRKDILSRMLSDKRLYDSPKLDCIGKDRITSCCFEGVNLETEVLVGHGDTPIANSHQGRVPFWVTTLEQVYRLPH